MSDPQTTDLTIPLMLDRILQNQMILLNRSLCEAKQITIGQEKELRSAFTKTQLMLEQRGIFQ